MNIQMFGTKKCRETQKAERFFKERKISFHFVDLTEKGISKGELDAVRSALNGKELIDRYGKEFSKSNLKFMTFDPAEEILKNPLLLKTPVIRNGKKATVGYVPDIWSEWINTKE